MTRRVLITGAGGFVGAHLAAGIASLGHDVTGMDLLFDAEARDALAGVTLVEAGIAIEMLSALGRFDTVIHAAAITSSPEDLGIGVFEHLRRNCMTTLDILAFAERCGARDVVFVSSSGVFSGDVADPVLLETTPAEATMPYSVAKRAGELFLECAEAAGIRALAVRLGPVYGPRERSRPSRQAMSPVRRWRDAARSGAPVVVDLPGSVRDWTYGPDLAGALLALLDRTPVLRGVVHLTSGEAIADTDLAACIAQRYGREAQAVATPAALPRKPMSSSRIAPRALYPWTPLAEGLEAVMGAAP